MRTDTNQTARLRSSHRRQIVEAWELHLIGCVASRFDTRERDDLRAELFRRLIQLKAQRPLDIRNWEAYIAKFLLNKASNLMRDRRMRDKRVSNFDALDESERDERSLLKVQAADLFGDKLVDQIAVAEVLRALPVRLRRFWIVLKEENGNRTRSAKRLGIHRNTLRPWLLEIRQILEKHGF